MIELVFTACLAASPLDCSERNLLYHGITPLNCTMGAHMELARWADSHPSFTVAEWKCRLLGDGDRPA
jgi:hypothetical protein